MKKNRTFTAILLVFCLTEFLTYYEITAQTQEFTRYFLTGGVSLSGNIHSSSFVQLPTVPNCCTNFTGGFGFGASVFAGMEYLPSSKMFGREYHPAFSVSMSWLSASLKENAVFANAINGNTVEQAISEHRIDASIAVLALEPSIYVTPSVNFPLDVKLGFLAGIPISASYTQAETLLSPSNRLFENGLKVRNESNGSLPEKSPMYLAALIGARYNFMESGNFAFSPEIQYNLGLTNIVSSLTWKISSIRAGIAVRYHIPVPTVPPPPPTPPPPPPTPKTLSMKFTISHDGRELQPADSVFVPVTVSREISAFAVTPQIFFGKNETALKMNDETEPSNTESAQKNPLSAIAQYLQTYNSVTVVISASADASEEKGIAEKRAEAITQYLQQKGITASRWKINILNASLSTNLREELLEEQRFVSVSFSDKQTVLPLESRHETTRTVPILFKIDPKLVAEATPITFDGQASLAGKPHQHLSEKQSILTFDELMLEGLPSPKRMIVNITVIDAEQKRVGVQQFYIIAPRKIINETKHIALTNSENDSTSEQLILGYFNFDRAEFSAINDEAVLRVKNAIKEGKQLEFMPLTDNLGTPEHNARLAQERGRAALKLLNLKANEVNFSTPKDSFFSNSTPSGRIMNRSVVVKIAK